MVKTSNICCLAGDTLVTTQDGPKKISSLVGQTAKIWDGESWVENSSFERRGVDRLIRVHLKDGSYVDSNADHRWFAASSYEDIRQNLYPEVLTRNLKVGQWLEYHSSEQHGKLEEKGAYLKGFLVGDGTSSRGKPILNVHSTKFSCLGQLLESASEISVGQARADAIKEAQFGDTIDNSGRFNTFGAQIFKSMKGLTARKNELYPWASDFKKDLPDRIFSWSKNSKLNFLAGILDSDGVVNKHSDIQIASIHKNVIFQLQRLIKTFGFSGNVDTMIREDSGSKNIHRLSISCADSFKLLQMMPVRRLKIGNKEPNRKSTGWRKIVKIEELDGTHPVYCPILPSTGKFALANGLMTGNTEITLFTDPDHSFVCCLSSMNLVKYDEWKDTDAIQLSIRFLDAVLAEYIVKSEGVPGLEASRRSAIKGRAVGLGVLGWHTLLQNQMIPFDSYEAMMLNAQIFRKMRADAEEATASLAIELGEPEWCKGFNRRNTHLLAPAPTVSNSLISGGHSAGIEPIAANIYSQKSAKGTFIRKNATLEAFLETKSKNTDDVWKSINEMGGSVEHLKFLSDHEKAVFLTAREINQHAIIKQAAQRQKWIDQSQSVNLFFGSNADPKYIHQVHVAAWEQGLKTLYYCRSEGVLRGDLASRSKEECAACEA